jgi:hypothetical protein
MCGGSSEAISRIAAAKEFQLPSLRALRQHAQARGWAATAPCIEPSTTTKRCAHLPTVLGCVLISQPNPIGDSPMTTAKPPARYSAMESARAGDFATPSGHDQFGGFDLSIGLSACRKNGA